MSIHLTVLLLAAAGSISVIGASPTGNTEPALDHVPTSAQVTTPAELVPVSAENVRFSRLLKGTANALQFSSISNDAPPIWGIRRDAKKDGKSEKVTKGNSISASNFGRRALDYEEPHQGFEVASETKIVAHPYPGNEYVYVRAGKLDQQVEAATNPHHLDSDVSASVTTINNKPPRVPLAILRQKKGKRVNITPLFTELPPQVHQDSSVNAAKEFVWVDQPAGEHHPRVIAVNRRGRKHEEVEEVTTYPSTQEEELGEVTTLLPLPEDLAFESSTNKQHNSKLIVNIVTSEPRVSVESSSREKKSRYHSRRTKGTTASTSTTTTTSTTSEATTIATSSSTEVTSEAAPQTTTPYATTTTSRVPTTTVTHPTLSSSSPKNLVGDEKENLVADASQRDPTFHAFEDSQTKLQTAESNQPARVNVRPAQNGKEYEYEYIYYYYDDEGENGENSGENHGKAGKKEGKQTSAPSTTTTQTASSPVSDETIAPAPVTTAVVTSTTTTTTSTQPPDLSDADFEYEDDASDEEVHIEQKLPEIQKSTPAVIRTTEAPIHKAISSAEKLSNSNPINQLDRSRSPKVAPIQQAKYEEEISDYKLETEASQEDVVQTHAQSKGQPIHHQTALSSEEGLEEEEEETDDAPAPVPLVHVSIREPSTLAPVPPSTVPEFDIPDHMSTLAKTHKDSVNVPIVLKQSSLLKAVPVSHLHSQGHQSEREPLSTVAYTTPPTTTTTVETSTEAVHQPRPGAPRRGHRLRVNGGNAVTPRPSTSTTTVSEQPATPTEERAPQAARRPHGSRRVPVRRPVQESSASESTPEHQPVASPVIENHARPLPIRPRFPPRNGSTTAAAAASAEVVSDSPPVQPVATVSAAELNSLEDKKSKDSHIRAKSANDLFAFTRLQQAISSRAPSRIPPKLVAGFVNSGEVTTDAVSSSEVTTVSSNGGQSSENVGLPAHEPPSTAAPTTTTTTEAVQLDKFGRPKGGRFGGTRARRPLGGGASSSQSTTTTEAPTTQRPRFTGGRRGRTSTTEAPEGAAQKSTASTNNEEQKAKIPQRNRFSSRNRGFSTTEAAPAEVQKSTDSDKPSSAPAPRRRPGAGGFQGRRRPNQIQSPTETTAGQEETVSTAAAATATEAGSTAAVTSTPASALPGRNRFNFNTAAGRPRPGAPAAPGSNPLRARGGGRLRASTSTTTEAAPEETPDAHEQTDPEQSQTIQNENLEQPLQSAPPAPEAPALPQRGGVLGRLKSRPKLVVTTTVPPEAIHNKPARLNGLLGRKRNLGQLQAAAHVKEEVKEAPSDGAEEANNHALEQVDDDHKGVVVQVSSSVTESEEVNEGHAGEVLEPPSTTPGSILNRLKSQRKPGSLFRKKPDPHGE